MDFASFQVQPGAFRGLDGPEEGLLGEKIQGLGQQLGHFVGDFGQFFQGGRLAGGQGDAYGLGHRLGGGADPLHGPVRAEADEPPANVQAAFGDHAAAVKEDQVGGAAADVQVDGGAGIVQTVLKGAAAFSGDDGLQVRPGGGDHELPGKAAELLQHGGGVFLPGRLPGDDDRPGVHVLGSEPCLAVLVGHDVPDGLAVNEDGGGQGGEKDGAFVNDSFLHNGDPGDGEIAGGVFHGDPAEHQLGGGGADVDPHA